MKDKINNIISSFKNFYNNTYGMLITLSWVLLIICLIIKLFGGNWFELGTENSKFIEFCNYVETRQYLKMSIGCVIAIITTYPLYCVMLKEQKPKLYKIITLMILLVIKCIISWYNSIVSFCLDIFVLLILMTILNKNFKRNIIYFLIVNVLQIITILIRNISFGFGGFNLGNTFIEQALIQIDYYIMILLIYLYTFKKRKENK